MNLLIKGKMILLKGKTVRFLKVKILIIIIFLKEKILPKDINFLRRKILELVRTLLGNNLKLRKAKCKVNNFFLLSLSLIRNPF